MAAPQQAVVATNQPQPSVVITTTPASAWTEINKAYQAKLHGLAITELVLGSLCFNIGAAISGIVGSGPYSYTYYDSYGYQQTRYKYGYTTGEGIWCGIWIIIAGALGVRVVMPFASRCLITNHMAFSIVASVFSGVMFIISVVGAIIAEDVRVTVHEAHLVALFSILCVISFVSMILLIISASYCCKALTCCCSDVAGQGCDCCMPCGQPNTYGEGKVFFAQQAQVGGQAVVYPQQQAGIGGQLMVYAQQPGMAGQQVAYAQQPIMTYQGALHVPQGYIVQGAQPMVQPGFQGTVIQPNRVVENQGVQNSEKAQQEFGAFEDTPPSYQSPQ